MPPRGRGAKGKGKGRFGGGGRFRRPELRRFSRRKVCKFCADKTVEIDYRQPQVLKHFTTERAKIIPRRISGNCARHQRALTVAIKRARLLALLPYGTSHG